MQPGEQEVGVGSKGALSVQRGVIIMVIKNEKFPARMVGFFVGALYKFEVI